MKGLIDGFTIFGKDIKFYGIIMALAMLIGVILACKNAKERGIKSDSIYTLALYVLPLSIIGARLVYVLGALDEFSSFWEIFAVWQGGLSIYGGIIGGAGGVFLFSVVHKVNFFNLTDVAVISLILGQAIGRWGNFFNQEVYGSVVTSKAWQWFPFAVYLDNGTWHYALFFYEFVLNVAIFIGLYFMLKRTKTAGYVSGAYLVCYGTIRFILEPLRETTYNLMIGGLKLSSIISLLSIIIGITIIVLIYTKSKRGQQIDKR